MQDRWDECVWRGIKPTGCYDIVDNDNLLTRLDPILLYLEEIRAIFFLISGGLNWTGQLALLPNGDESRAESQREAWPEKKASGFEANDDIWLLTTITLGDVKLEGPHKGFVQAGIGEDREDVLEENSRRGEVWELAESAVKSYFKTGEFGGAGGGGGGESSLGGMVGMDGGVGM